MPSNEPKTVETAPTPDAPLTVIWTPPIDPGDAGGVGNGDERTIAPDSLHETAEEMRDRGGKWRPT